MSPNPGSSIHPVAEQEPRCLTSGSQSAHTWGRKNNGAGHQWLEPVILAPWSKTGRISVQSPEFKPYPTFFISLPLCFCLWTSTLTKTVTKGPLHLWKASCQGLSMALLSSNSFLHLQYESIIKTSIYRFLFQVCAPVLCKDPKLQENVENPVSLKLSLKVRLWKCIF